MHKTQGHVWGYNLIIKWKRVEVRKYEKSMGKWIRGQNGIRREVY